MKLGYVGVIARRYDLSADFFNVSTCANPFCTHGRKSLCHVSRKVRITPWPARVVYTHRLIDFDITVHRLSWCQGDFAERNANTGMQLARNVNPSRMWQRLFDRIFGVVCTHTLQGRRSTCEISIIGKRGACPATGPYSPTHSYRSVSIRRSTATRGNRIAEITSPASDPRSLRRHYPHQVQGVVQSDLSAMAAPPLFACSE